MTYTFCPFDIRRALWCGKYRLPCVSQGAGASTRGLSHTWRALALSLQLSRSARARGE